MKLRLPNKKCLSGIALSALCLSMTSAYADPPLLEPIPLFTPYNLDAAPKGYIIKGTIYAPGPSGPVATPNAVMVVDPPDPSIGKTGRVAYYFAPIGIFITNETASYHINLRGSPVCFVNPDFKYSTYEQNYQQIRSLPGSTQLAATYAGYTRDSFSCDQNINFTFKDRLLSPGPGKPLIRATTDLYVALPTPVGSNCVQAQAYFVGDPQTLDTDPSHFDQYFTIPTNCTGPLNVNPAGPFSYCPLAYPQGNACETQYAQ
jgi:hypothetical protein